jgi:hypothetical protein
MAHPLIEKPGAMCSRNAHHAERARTLLKGQCTSMHLLAHVEPTDKGIRVLVGAGDDLCGDETEQAALLSFAGMLRAVLPSCCAVEVTCWTKTCTTCRKDLALREFPRSRGTVGIDGRRVRCLRCEQAPTGTARARKKGKFCSKCASLPHRVTGAVCSACGLAFKPQ